MAKPGTGSLPCKGRGQLRRPTSWTDREHGVGVHGVAGDGNGEQGLPREIGGGITEPGAETGVHGLWPEQAVPRKVTEPSYERGSGVMPAEQRRAGKWSAAVLRKGVNGWRSAVRLCAPATMGSASPDDSRLSLNRKERSVPGLPGQRSFKRSATITGKAGCGRSARPVWEGGWQGNSPALNLILTPMATPETQLRPTQPVKLIDVESAQTIADPLRTSL